MDLNLKAPPVLRGSEIEQIGQIRSYLYQMQQALLIALEKTDMDKLAEEVTQAVRGGGELPDGGDPTIHEAYRKLKAIIIKTAGTVQSSVDELSTRLESDYVATSTFGEYQESASLQMQATATEVVQSYQYDSKLEAMQGSLAEYNDSLNTLDAAISEASQGISALDTYNIQTEQYIKTGLLFFDENNVPRYGVAVGENLTKVIVNGEVVIERTGLAATFTSDRLSFWQNEVEVAYISNNQLYIQEARILGNLHLGNWVFDTSYGFALKWVGV